MQIVRRLMWVCLVFLVSAGPFAAVYAQSQNDTVTLGVSPQVLELTINPGESQTSTFRLTNASKEKIEVKATPKNFTPRGEEGAVDLTEDRTGFSLSEWLTATPDEAVLEPAATKDFTIKIEVPDNAEPGSHFGSIVFQTIPPAQEGANALVAQEIAPVILVKVAGDIHESAEIAGFSAAKSFYSTENSVELAARIKNTGNVHFKPTGKVIIKNMFGKEAASLELDKKNVLPDSIRQITTNWQPGRFAIGRYRATLTVVTGSDNQISTAETTIVIFPYQYVIPLIIGIAVLGILLFKGRTRLQNAANALRGKDSPGK